MFHVSSFRKNGFTLVELLMVIGVAVILTAVSFPVFLFFRRESSLANDSGALQSILETAQNKSLASEGASSYGVYFDISVVPHKFISFKGNDFELRDSSFDSIYDISKEVEIYGIDLAGGNEVVFSRITGIANPGGSVSLRLKQDSSKTKTIYIEESGLISLSSPSSPSDEPRIKDARHVHFDLGWSIQEATVLKFYFPVNFQTETIDMADYFSGGGAEFDWQGVFLVEDEEQSFRVHVHYLDVSNTDLCVHRDRTEGKTGKEVIIYIVHSGIDKEIAHYSGDENDAVSAGIFGGIMEIQ